MGSEISPTNDLTLSLFHCVKLTKRRCLILLLGVSNQTLLMPKSKDSRYLLRVWKHAHNHLNSHILDAVHKSSFATEKCPTANTFSLNLPA
jgi:hypothetical protein